MNWNRGRDSPSGFCATFAIDLLHCWLMIWRFALMKKIFGHLNVFIPLMLRGYGSSWLPVTWTDILNADLQDNLVSSTFAHDHHVCNFQSARQARVHNIRMRASLANLNFSNGKHRSDHHNRFRPPGSMTIVAPQRSTNP